jgi:hypothetical protein
LIGHRAQHQRCDGGVHAGIGTGQGIGGAVDHADGDGSLVGGGFGQGAEVRLRLDGEQLGDRWRVVGEVKAVAGADLQNPAG